MGGLSGPIWLLLGLSGPIWAYLGYLGLSWRFWFYLGHSEPFLLGLSVSASQPLPLPPPSSLSLALSFYLSRHLTWSPYLSVFLGLSHLCLSLSGLRPLPLNSLSLSVPFSRSSLPFLTFLPATTCFLSFANSISLSCS